MERPTGAFDTALPGAASPPPIGAPLRYRLLAMLYDGLALLGIWAFTVVLLVTVRGDVVAGVGVQAFLGLEAYAFFIFFWMRRGQTLGMVAWRLRFTSANARVSARQAHLRLIGGALSLACLGVGHWWIPFDRQRRGWPDLLSGSRIGRVAR